jgi:hypothetical protein
MQVISMLEHNIQRNVGVAIVSDASVLTLVVAAIYVG